MLRISWLRATSWVLLFGVLLGAAACSRRREEAGTVSQVLRDSVTEKITTMDPAAVYDLPSRNATIQVYEGLVGLDDQLRIVPLLAERWEKKGNSIVFHLRPGVRFQDDPAFPGGRGRVVQAADVKYSFERVLKPSTKSPWTYAFSDIVKGAADFLGEKTHEVPGFKVIDQSTFEIEMIHPFGAMLSRLTASGLGIVPREAVEKYGDSLKFKPVGTGPFQIVEANPDSKLLFRRFQGYWQTGLPGMEQVELRILRDAAMQMLEFQSGKLDTLDLSLTQFREVMDEGGKLRPQFQKYQLRSTPAMNLKFLGFNLKKKPWGSDPRLRQAVSLAIDRQVLVDNVLRGEAMAARSILPPGVPGYDPGRPPMAADPRQAKQLLQEAGYPNGNGLPELVIEFETTKEKEYAAQALVAMLGQVGIRARVDIMNEPVLIERINAGSFTCVFGYWVGDYPDAEQFFMAFDSRNMPPTGFNLSRFSDPVFDGLYQKSLLADGETRVALLRQAEQRVLDAWVWLPLYHNVSFKLQQPGLEGLAPSPLLYSFYKWARWQSR